MFHVIVLLLLMIMSCRSLWAVALRQQAVAALLLRLL
jgi:hypothetical protein